MISDLPTYCDEHVRELYTRVAADAWPGDKLVEVGVAFGSSLAFLARQLIDAGKEGVQVFGFDRWEAWGGPLAIRDKIAAAGGFYEAFRAEMERHAPEELARVVIMRMPSVEAAGLFAPESLAFVFIDAEHTHESVRADIAAWWPKVRPGGMIAGHDWGREFPGVERAVREFFRVPSSVPGEACGIAKGSVWTIGRIIGGKAIGVARGVERRTVVLEPEGSGR